MHWTDILTSCGRRRKQEIEIPFSKLIFNPLFYATNKEYLYGNNVLNKMYIAFKNYKYYRIKMIIHLQHSFKTKWIENNIGTELSMLTLFQRWNLTSVQSQNQTCFKVVSTLKVDVVSTVKQRRCDCWDTTVRLKVVQSELSNFYLKCARGWKSRVPRLLIGHYN